MSWQAIYLLQLRRIVLFVLQRAVQSLKQPSGKRFAFSRGYFIYAQRGTFANVNTAWHIRQC